MPSRSSAPRTKVASTPTPSRPSSAAGLQPDLVETGREHVPRHAAGRLRRSSSAQASVGLPLAANARTPEAEFLHGRPGQGCADLRDQADDVAIGRGIVQRAQGRTQLMMSAGAKPRERVVHARRDRKFGQVEFEQQRRSVTRQRHSLTVTARSDLTNVTQLSAGACSSNVSAIELMQ